MCLISHLSLMDSLYEEFHLNVWVLFTADENVPMLPFAHSSILGVRVSASTGERVCTNKRTTGYNSLA